MIIKLNNDNLKVFSLDFNVRGSKALGTFLVDFGPSTKYIQILKYQN
jgi:hypothetical protein